MGSLCFYGNVLTFCRTGSKSCWGYFGVLLSKVPPIPWGHIDPSSCQQFVLLWGWMPVWGHCFSELYVGSCAHKSIHIQFITVSGVQKKRNRKTATVQQIVRLYMLQLSPLAPPPLRPSSTRVFRHLYASINFTPPQSVPEQCQLPSGYVSLVDERIQKKLPGLGVFLMMAKIGIKLNSLACCFCHGFTT